MEELEKKWGEILHKVKDNLELTNVTFDTWIKPLKIYAVQDGCAYIVWDSEQLGISYLTKKYMLPLKVAILEVIGAEYEIKFMLPEHAEKMTVSNTEDPLKVDVAEGWERKHMDIYKFINSKDIAEYLMSINYEFSLPEMAFLVYQSSYRTLDEKFDAWQEMIDTMPNCSMDERFNMVRIENFHQFLRNYMALQRKMLQMFYDADGAVYTYELYERLGLRTWKSESEFEERGIRWIELGEYFADAAAALAHFKKNKSDYTEDGVQRVRLLRRPLLRQLDLERSGEIWVEMTPDLEVLSVDHIGFGILNDEEDTLDRQFDGMCFAFPTPFHRGDIIIDRTVGIRGGRSVPIVLNSISTWNEGTLLENGVAPVHPKVKTAGKRLESILKNADISDMNYSGYYLDANGVGFPILFADSWWTYLNLERYEESLQGLNRVLKVLSSGLTYDAEAGEPSVSQELLCNAYQLILTEEMCKLNRCWMEKCYTEEGKELVGLKEERKGVKPQNGVFWYVDGQMLAYPFREDVHIGGVAKSENTYAHEKLWEEVRPKGCNKPFDYYPRGRTVVKEGKRSVIYMSPHVDRTLLPEIIRVFGLEEDPVIRYDHSEHYKCHLDSEDGGEEF